MTFGARNVFPVPAQKNPDLDFVFFSLEPFEETLDSFVAALAFEDGPRRDPVHRKPLQIELPDKDGRNSPE